MKRKAGFFAAVVLALLVFSEAGCNKKPSGPNVVTYSYQVPILNPPDTFQVAYNLYVTNNLTARITFQDSAVWKIQKITQNQVNFGFINPANNSTVFINSPDTAGFRGNLQYTFIVNNLASSDSTLGMYYVKFTKLPLDYSSFPHRY